MFVSSLEFEIYSKERIMVEELSVNPIFCLFILTLGNQFFCWQFILHRVC